MVLLPLLAILAATPAPPKPGQVAPDFTATTSDGKSVTLSELVKERTVVLAFFPKAFTPGCTMQMKAFRDQYVELEKKGATVLAISMDDAETLEKFKKDLNAPFTFVPDPVGVVSTRFGMRDPGAHKANRGNIVVGEGMKVLQVETGLFAVNPDEAVAACPLRKQK